MVWIIENLQNLALSISEYITQAIYTLVHCLFYPFQLILSWIDKISKLIINTLVSFIGVLWDSFHIVYDFVTNMFIGMLPSLWITLILLAITIIFTLRLYHFIKDISIAGFKI